MNTQGLVPDASAGLRRRQSIFDGVIDFFDDLTTVKDQRAVDLLTDFSWQVLFSQAITNTDLSASIECNECRVRGGLDINIEFEIFSGFTGFAEVRPSNLGADIVLDVRTSSTSSSDTQMATKSILMTDNSSKSAEKSLRLSRRRSACLPFPLEASLPVH